MSTTGRSLPAVVAGLAALITVAGCGGSSTPGKTATSPAAGSSQATGSPVRVVSIIDEEPSVGLAYPTLREGFKVAAEWINSHGGLGGSGHTVEVSFCVTQLNPNGSTSCARQAADDTGIVATVGNVLNFSQIVNPILEKAGLASLAPQPYSEGDGTSPIAFPVNASYVVTSPAMGAECIDVAHAKKVSLLYVNVPSASAALKSTVQLIKDRGVQVVNQVPVAIGTADLSPYVAKLLAGGTQCVALLTDPATAVKVVQAARAQGSKVAFAGNVSQFTPKTVDKLGSAGDGLYVSSMFATNSVDKPGVQAFVSAMKKYGDVGDSDDFSKQAWVAMQLLNDATKGTTTIDRQSVLAAMKKMTTWDSGGLLPVIDFTAKGTLLNGSVPRFTNPDMFYAQVKNGELVPTQGDTFSNPFQGS